MIRIGKVPLVSLLRAFLFVALCLGEVAIAAADAPGGGSAAAIQGRNTALDDTYELAIGDRLSFQITEDDEEPARQIIVTDAGDIDVPYLGRVPAANKTCSSLAQEIKSALEKTYYYQATVLIAVDQMSRTRGKVYIVGYVNLPGPQEIPSDETFTLSKAIMRAGGFNDFADKKHVRVTRKPSPGVKNGDQMEVDVGSVIEQGKSDRDVTLQPGDVVYVPSRLFKF